MESPTPTTTTTASAPGDFQKYTHTTADNTPTPPFLRLPPELVLRIFGFVALQGLPTDLARLCLTTRRFYIYLSDPGRSFDQSIWRSSATVLMGECVPNTLTLENTWRAFVQRVWRLTKPVQVGTDVQALEQGEVLVTSAGGPFPEVERVTEVEDGVETVTQDKQTAEDEPKRTQELLTPVPAGARRVVDFVHSGTEGSRGDLWGMSYVGANSGAFFTFADDPRDWVHTPKQIEKGYISGDGSLVDGKGIVTAGVQSLHHLLGDTVGLEESTQLTSFKAWLRSNIHSDADLNIIPKAVKRTPFECRVEVSKVERYSSPGVIDKTWTLQNDSWNVGSPGNPPDPYAWEGPWSNDQNWEFRSAGDYLIICDDNDGEKESTVTCFRSGECTSPLWQRKMTGTDTTADGRPWAFFYDNDGIRMNTAFVAYASRTKRSFAVPEPNINCMEFILLSTQTGEIVHTLRMPHEERMQAMHGDAGLDSWCSFSLTDTVLAATVGGRIINASTDDRYQYRQVLLWNLAVPGTHHAPTHAIELPRTWIPYEEAYTALSADGRWLGVQVGLEMGVWDLEKREAVNVWRVKTADRYLREPIWDVMDRVAGWNGLWVKYRDIFDQEEEGGGEKEEEEEEEEEAGSPASFHTAHEMADNRVEHHVAFFSARMLRRIFDLHNLLDKGLQVPDSGISLDSDSEYDEGPSDGDDDDEDDEDNEDDDDEEQFFNGTDYDGMAERMFDDAGWEDEEDSDSNSSEIREEEGDAVQARVASASGPVDEPMRVVRGAYGDEEDEDEIDDDGFDDID